MKKACRISAPYRAEKTTVTHGELDRHAQILEVICGNALGSWPAQQPALFVKNSEKTSALSLLHT